jgi:phospholipid transport system substrate-binding protein
MTAALVCLAADALAIPQYGGGGPGYGALPEPSMLAPVELQEDSPAVQLRDGVNKLLGFMDRDAEPTLDELAAFLDQEIAPFFDFEYMARIAAGPAARFMSDEQRAKMVARLQAQFLSTLTERLSGYEEQQVRFLPMRLNRDGRTGEASIAVLNPGRYPARIDFRFYRGEQGWKVYDVAANGQSAVAHYRREFREAMRRGGLRGRRGYGYPGGAATPYR